MERCIFCAIVAGTRPAAILYNDEEIIAFRDINPQAPVHGLIVPREHIPAVQDCEPRHAVVVGRMHLIANRLARELGLLPGGYRLVINCGPDAGQSVGHLHLHLLGGRRMGWPPWPNR